MKVRKSYYSNNYSTLIFKETGEKKKWKLLKISTIMFNHLCVCHFTFLFCTDGFRLLYRTTIMMMQHSILHAAVLNTIQLSFFFFLIFILLTCVNLKRKMRRDDVQRNKEKKRMRTEIRSSGRYSTNKDGNYQLFLERDIFVLFVDDNDREVWAE
jgi:hypothetical protein